MHEIVVALVVIRGQTAVFVQIEGRAGAEIDVALVIPLDELLVNADGRGAGRETEHGLRLQDDLRGDDVRGLAAHVVIVFCADDFHNALPLSFFVLSENRRGRLSPAPSIARSAIW